MKGLLQEFRWWTNITSPQLIPIQSTRAGKATPKDGLMETWWAQHFFSMVGGRANKKLT